MKYMKKLLCLVLVVLCAAILAVPAAAEETAPAVPTATVTDIPEAELVEKSAPDLTFALKFLADTVTEEQIAYYGDWYADFVLTVSKTTVFDASDETADGYLAGEYGNYGWISVPFEPVTLEANASLKIMEYAASLMGQPGLKVTYNDVYYGVQEFNCGVFFTPEFIAENPDLMVTLSLQMYDPADESNSYPIGPVYTFYAGAATVTDSQGGVKYYAALTDAVAAAQDGDTVTLLNSATLAEGQTISVSKNITIDMNGCAISPSTALVKAESKCLQIDGSKYIYSDHDQEAVLSAVPAGCTTDGLTEGKSCSGCGKIMVAQETVPAGHTLTPVAAKAATYTTAGNTAYHTCSVCSKLFTDAEGKTETTLEKVTIPKLILVEETKAEVSTGAVDTAISNAATSGDVVLDLNEVASGSVTESETPAAVTSAQLPVASLEQVAEISEEATLTVSMAEATVVVDAAAMAAVAEQAEGTTVTLKVEQIETETLTQTQQSAVANQKVVAAISASFVCSEGKEIHDFKGGSVTVAMPFIPEEGTEGTDYVVVYVADDGTTEEIPTTFASNTLVFTLEHFSEYVIVNTNVPTNGNPATGDMGILNYAVAMLLSGAGMMAVLPKKREEI